MLLNQLVTIMMVIEIFRVLHVKMNEVYVAICKPKHRK
jgi:hypothetical protein